MDEKYYIQYHIKSKAILLSWLKNLIFQLSLMWKRNGKVCFLEAEMSNSVFRESVFSSIYPIYLE